MPSKQPRYRLTQIQMEAAKKLRVGLGFSQEELAREGERRKIILSRATIQRLEGNGGGWVKRRTHLDLVKLFKLCVSERTLDIQGRASCLHLLNTLKGDGVFVHGHVNHFIKEVELPSFMSLYPVKSKEDLESWWMALEDPPNCVDQVEIEAKRALEKFAVEDLEWVDQLESGRRGLLIAEKSSINQGDLDQVGRVIRGFQKWARSWDGFYQEEMCLKDLGQDLQNLTGRGIFTSLGLALASTPESLRLASLPHHEYMSRKWRVVIAFGLRPIESFQVWWQKDPKTPPSLVEEDPPDAAARDAPIGDANSLLQPSQPSLPKQGN